MSWGSIRGHDDVADNLRRTLEQGRLPHAFLFVGPSGIGKKMFALRLAQSLLCQRRDPQLLEPCEQCPSCLQIRSLSHPDVLMVAKPEERMELPIALIRQLCADLGLKPMSGDRRIAIIDDADDINEEASNAFLKALEEPPAGAVLIMIGTSAEMQLDTILSRCRVLQFRPLSESDLAQVLVDRGISVSSADAVRLAKLAEGSVQRAIGLANPDFAQFRRDVIDILAAPNGVDAPGLAKKMLNYIQGAAKDAGPRRQKAALLFAEIAGFLRSILWQTAGLEPPSPDPKDRQAAITLANRLEPEDLFIMADRCILADYQIQRILYMPPVLDALTLALAKPINQRLNR